MELMAKPVSQSRSEQIQVVMYQHINSAGRLFGGQLVAWIDVLAAVVAHRHCNSEVTTASIDNLNFKKPVHLGDTIVIKGQVTYVGHTSMEIRTDTYVEALDGTQSLVNRAYLTFVALDKQGHSRPVPGLLPETEEERAEWEAGVKRTELRHRRRIEQY